MLDFCPNCFEKTSPGINICPKCGYDTSQKQKEGRLPFGTMLNDQFVIGCSIGQGGFGITYKAYDTFNDRIVAVKEYMPSEYAHREKLSIVPNEEPTRAKRIFENGKTNYIAEIKTLYKFRDERNIVEIIQHFTENNTVYLIMEFLDGHNLKAAMSQKGGRIDIAKARDIIYDIAKILEKVHKEGILHRDISPENIFIVNKKNVEEVKLIDFGAAKSYVETAEKDNSVFLKPGFAPPEQYSSKGNQGPWTDVYALAATLYYIVSGISVQDAKKRMENDMVKPLCEVVGNVSINMSKAVEKAMQLDYKYRTQNCTEFLNDLDRAGWTMIGGDPRVKKPPVSKPTTKPLSPPTPPKPSVTPARPPYQSNLVCNVVAKNSQINQSITFQPGNTIVIGRFSNDCNFVPYNDTHISRRHCYITYNMDTNLFYVTDVSSNGTFRMSGQQLVKNQKEVFRPGESFFLAQYNNIITLMVYRQ
ncbi:MAG: protein kinase [Clostridia bacterium]|nr:protein kinase [Clostridia bacterium]